MTNIEAARASRRKWYYKNVEHAKEKSSEYKVDSLALIDNYISQLVCMYCKKQPVKFYKQDSVIPARLRRSMALDTAIQIISVSRPICDNCVSRLRVSTNGKARSKESYVEINRGSTNNRRNEQLGMPHGTAAHQLRRNILFHLLKKYNENVCFKCGLAIETPEEISIEHKLPWLDNDINLFWDLDNIAFSHKKCNIPHRHSGGTGESRRKIGPKGTSWCGRCQDFVEESLFTKGNQWNGLYSICNPCRSKMRKRSTIRV